MTDDILTTRGIRSDVHDKDMRIGHVLFADYDGGFTPSQVADEIRDKPGINLLFNSSGNSYHYWNLTVKPASDVALDLLELHADPRHTQIGWRKGRWTIRTQEKNGYDGTTYKSMPSLVKAWYNQTDRPQSEPHWNYVRALHSPGDFESQINYVGDAYTVEKYMTLTDSGKQKVRAND